MDNTQSKQALRLRIKHLETELLKFGQPQINLISEIDLEKAKEIIPLTDINDLLIMKSFCESKSEMVNKAINSVNFLTEYFKVCEGRDVTIKVFNKKKKSV